MNIFVLLYNSGTDKEGIHSLELKGRTIVLPLSSIEWIPSLSVPELNKRTNIFISVGFSFYIIFD